MAPSFLYKAIHGFAAVSLERRSNLHVFFQIGKSDFILVKSIGTGDGIKNNQFSAYFGFCKLSNIGEQIEEEENAERILRMTGIVKEWHVLIICRNSKETDFDSRTRIKKAARHRDLNRGACNGGIGNQLAIFLIGEAQRNTARICGIVGNPFVECGIATVEALHILAAVIAGFVQTDRKLFAIGYFVFRHFSSKIFPYLRISCFCWACRRFFSSIFFMVLSLTT